MNYCAKELNSRCNFFVTKVAYAGEPEDNSIMYIGKKVEYLINNLSNIKESIVFIDDTIVVDDNIEQNNCIIRCSNPQYEYAKLLNKIVVDSKKDNRYKMTSEGYFLGENTIIGDNTIIEPGCVIGPDVTIGDNSVIMANSVIKNATIGEDFRAHEGCIIGTDGFALVKDYDNNWQRLPTLGRVLIGNHVDIGQGTNISRGTAKNTVLEDYVKVDALVHIGHDAKLMKNAEITAGGIVGGYAILDVDSSMGINSTIRNRIHIGSNTMVGMGSVVTKTIENDVIVIGNPARRK